MTVIVEFTVDEDDFLLGRVLTDAPDIHIELERIIPAGEYVVPFFWVRGTDLDRFEQQVSTHEMVSQIVALDRLDDWTLYRIEWDDPADSLLEGIDTIGGVILEATRDDGWQFRLRFPNHNALSQFYNYCMEQDISIHIERSFTLTEKSDVGRQFDLSQPQREALIAALQGGYFDTPSQVSLEELADEFGISKQALSNRIRRGTKEVLQLTLL
jgi:hypothetical protein